MPLTALLQRLGTEDTSCTTATEFSGYVKKLPSIRPTEKLVLSQVLVPPLVQEYVAVKQEWMKQKLWKQEDFIEVLDESCDEEMKPQVIEALHAFLEMRMDAHIRDLKSRKDPNWKRLLVDSFETTLSDPKVSSNVQKYVVPDSDPVEALRGQQGLKTVMASEIFVIGVFRSRTMFELPTYLEHERISSPPGFPKSPYWWALQMDRYALDANPYCPHWMSSTNHASKKRKRSAGKVSKLCELCLQNVAHQADSPPRRFHNVGFAFLQGYGITYSAFGYGNETVLCNDPHPTPWTDLNDAEVNQEAADKGNVSVRICRIGPWVFPIQVTTSFLPKAAGMYMQPTLATFTGTPLLYYYGKGYWVTARADQALATMADERESTLRREQEQTRREIETMKQAQVQLRRENEDLKGCLQELHQKHGHAALGLVQASLEAGRAIAALSPSDGHPQPAVMYETPTRQLVSHAVTPHGADTVAQATALPPESVPAGTSQPQPASRNINHMPKAARQLGRVFGVNKAGLSGDTVGQLQGALGQPAMGPRASVTAPPGVLNDVQDLRQGLASLLQQMTQLAANLYQVEQQQPQQQQQEQPSFEKRSLNQLEPQQVQHGITAAHELVQTTHQQKTLLAAAEQLATQVPTSHAQQSMHSMQQEAVQTCEKPPSDELLSAVVIRQQQESSLQAVPSADAQHAGATIQAVACDTATNEAVVPSGTEYVLGDKLAGGEEAETSQPVVPQALAAVVQKATKRNADKGSKPRRSKKRKGSEMTGTVRADSSSQPEAAAEGQPLQDGLMQWGGKQKRKHTKQASCGLPDQAHRASQQRLLRPYFATPPAVAHPSEGNFPAATPPVAESPDDLCHAKGARACRLSPEFQAAADLNKALGDNADPKEDGGHTDDMEIPCEDRRIDDDWKALVATCAEFEGLVEECNELALAAQQQRQNRPADTLFVVVSDTVVDTGGEGPSLMRRRVIAPEDDHTQVHLLVKDVQEICGGRWPALGRPWLDKAEYLAGPLPRGVSYCSGLEAVQYSRHGGGGGSSSKRWVMAAHALKALLLPGVLTDEQRKRLHRVTAGMWSSGTTPVQTSLRADANSPEADAHSPKLHHSSNLPAGVSTTEAAARGADSDGAAAQRLEHHSDQQQARGLSRLGDSMSSDSSSSSSSGEEEHSCDGNGLVMSHGEARAGRAVAGARALATCSAEAATRAEGQGTTERMCCKQPCGNQPSHRFHV
ncbi:hypothetical protein ABBQ38_001613 [Trebouxia sp. C0009 RCD-2024]